MFWHGLRICRLVFAQLLISVFYQLDSEFKFPKAGPCAAPLPVLGPDKEIDSFSFCCNWQFENMKMDSQNLIRYCPSWCYFQFSCNIWISGGDIYLFLYPVVVAAMLDGSTAAVPCLVPPVAGGTAPAVSLGLSTGKHVLAATRLLPEKHTTGCQTCRRCLTKFRNVEYNTRRRRLIATSFLLLSHHSIIKRHLNRLSPTKLDAQTSRFF